MKRLTNVLLAATIIAFAASCQKEIEQVVVPEENGFTVLTAKTDNDLQTRTSLSGLNVVWTDADIITAFDSEGAPFSSTVTELQNDEGTIVKFTVPTASPEYAVYPEVTANMVDGAIPATIPIIQNGKSGSFDNGANVAIAKVTDPDNLYFKNVGGLLAVKIKETTHTIKSIKISAEGTNMTGDILSSIDAQGNVTTAFSTADGAVVADYVEITSSSSFEVGDIYYAVVAPGTYNNVTVVFTDDAGKTATYTKNTPLVVERNSNQLIGGFSPDSRWVDEQQEVGPSYSWSMVSGDLGTTGDPASSVTAGDPELTWSLSYTWDLEEPTKYFGSNERGVQIGKGGDACTSLVLTTSGYTKSIESIRLNFSHASSGGSSASVKVGNVDLTCEGEASVAGTTSAQNYLFTAEELVSGNVVITLSNSASKAMYLKSIEINPDTRTEQVLSFPQASYSAELSEGTFSSPVLTGAITSVTYSSADEEVATVSNTGLVTLKKVGSTTITAIAVATEQYQEGSASYELTITEGPTSIAAVVSTDINSDVYTAGIVAQINTKGFIITDGDDNILVYQNAAPSVSVGQYVKVVGTRTAYNNIPQIGGSLTITQGDTGQTVTRTELTTISSSNATGFTSCEYVKLSGTLSISGNYINISIDGSATQGSIYNTNTSAEFNGVSISSMAGERVIVTGYVTGSTNSYLNIAPVDIVIDENYTTLEVSPSSLNWSAGEFGSDHAKTITISLNGNASGYTVTGSSSDWTVSDNESGTITVYPNEENTSTSDAKTLTLTITHSDNNGLSEDIICSQACSGEKINQILFHETFGDNSGSARNWNDSYSVKSGVQAVYSGISSYTVSNAKQGKNTTGAILSGLNQSASGTDAYIIIGPLNVAKAENMVLTYQWKAASIKGTYSTQLFYATSSSGTYTEVSGTGDGATTFVERSYSLPSTAQVATLYLKIVWNTSNTQAIIDEVNLQGDY